MPSEDKLLQEAVWSALDLFTEPNKGEVYLRDLQNDLLSIFDKYIQANYLPKSAVIEAIPPEDKHSHATRDYCLDCARRDGFSKALYQIKSNLGLEKGL